MPVSHHLPPLVLPDTPGGHYMAQHEPAWQVEYTRFCDEYREDKSNHRRCANRNATGDPAHVWCYACPAGYPFGRMQAKRHSISG